MLVSLFDYSGEWSRPYLEAGHEVLLVDIAHPPGLNRGSHSRCFTLGLDLSKPASLHRMLPLIPDHYGLLAAPPCDCFTRASAWLWDRWDEEGKTEEHLRMFDLTWKLVKLKPPKFWALENPPGRLWTGRGAKLVEGLRQHQLGSPKFRFDPWQFGAYAPDHPTSQRRKKTYLWGDFQIPVKAPHPEGARAYVPHLPPRRRGTIHQLGSRHKRERARTPRGFARAFERANPL